MLIHLQMVNSCIYATTVELNSCYIDGSEILIA